MTTDLDDQFADMELIRRRLADDLDLAVAITTADGRPDPKVSVVNVDVLDHPVSGAPVLAFVGRRGAKLRNPCRHPQLTWWSMPGGSGWRRPAGRARQP